MNHRREKSVSSEPPGFFRRPAANPTSKATQRIEQRFDNHHDVRRARTYTSKAQASIPLNSVPYDYDEAIRQEPNRSPQVMRQDPRDDLSSNSADRIIQLQDQLARLDSRFLAEKKYARSREVYIDELRQQTETANQKLREQEEGFRRQQDEIQALRAKEQSLRDFVLESNSDQVVSGDDVLCRFTSLRQKIQKIASSRTYRLGKRELPLWPKDNSLDASLAVLWEGSPPPIRRLILRSLIFQLLHNFVFSRETFDIKDAGLETTKGLAEALGRFERTVVEQGVQRDVVVNWRLSTFKCIDRAQLSGGASGEELQAYIYDGLSHLIAADAAEQERQKLADGYRELCKEAWDLQLLMRKGREPYQCLSAKRPCIKSLEPWEEVFEEMSGVGVGEDNAFTVFGALIKHSRIPGEDLKIMERAQIIATATEK